MTWDEMFAKENPPEFSDVTAYIQMDEWNQLYTELKDVIGAKPKLEHSRCSIPGWNIKFKKRGKNLCTVYPKQGTFHILIIANKPHQIEIEAVLKTCGERINTAYQAVDFFNGGKWVMYDVENQEHLDDALKLIQFRLQ